MRGSDDDEELRQAIALSLAEHETDSNGCTGDGSQASQVPPKPIDIIDLLSDEESHTPQKKKSTENPYRLASEQFTLRGLNRKEMEEQRLARKRKASISPPPPSRKGAKSTNLVAEPVKSSSSINATVSAPNPLQFPRGTVKKTWAFGHPRDQDIKIEEVLQRADLTLAVFSSFQWDVEWLLGKINANSTRMVFVMQAKEDATKRQYERDTASTPNLRLCFPDMAGQINCMHSKLMLIAHPSYLRVVVPTANLVPYDWGESGVMENMVFLIDLPRLAVKQILPENLTLFGRELIHFIRAMGLQEDVIRSVCNFDFSATKGLAFVHTIGGAHSGDADSWRHTGYCGLGRAVKELGLGSDGPLELDFVTSSIGALNIDFITMMYLAAKGDDGLMEFEWRTCKQAKTKDSKAAGQQDGILKKQTVTSIEQGFRIYFPAHDTVVNSKGGAACGGTICFQAKWYSAATFPRHLLRDCKSQRKGMLMHNKVCHLPDLSCP